MVHVLCVGRIHDQGLKVLEARSDISFEVLDTYGDEVLMPRLPEADGIVLRPGLSADHIAQAKRLKVVSLHGVGYNDVAVDALTRRRIPLVTVGGANAITVAEHAFGMMMALAKQTSAYDRAVREGLWSFRQSFVGADLYRKTLLILGLGRIGGNVAKRASAFGMRVLAYDPYLDAATVKERGAAKVESLDGALAEADFVTLHVPLTDETRGMIGGAQLALLKPTAFLINTSRGEAMDEPALVAALAEKRLRGAGIDVFAAEPPPRDHPLYAADNVILSPHSAAFTDECAARMGVTAAENVLAGLERRLDPSLVVNAEVLTAGR